MLGKGWAIQILLIPPKLKIKMVPSNYTNFQYCENLLLFLIALSNAIDLTTITTMSFSLLEAIAKGVLLLFAKSFKIVKEQQLYGKQYGKRSHEPIYKTY